MTVSANDAHPYPIYNARFRVTFPFFDADGDLVTGAATPDAELSQDSGTFADATNESTELATSSGMYYLDLIGTELDTRSTAIIAKSATAGMKTTPLVLYPRRLPILRTGTAQAGAASTITLDSGASAVDDFYLGCWVNITNDSPVGALGQARMITDYVGSTKVATIEGTWGTNPSSASTFEILISEWTMLVDPVRGLGSPTAIPNAAAEAAGGLYTRGAGAGQINQDANGRVDTRTAAMSADVVTAAAIASAAIDAATFAAGAIDAAAIATGAITAAKFAAGAIDAAAIATDAIGAAELATDAVTEIRSLVSGTSDSGTTTTMVDAARTEADADYWKGNWILFTSGTIIHQCRLITAFDPATDTITFAPATTQAVGTQTYEILPAGRADVALWLGTAVNALQAGRVDAFVGAMAAAVITSGAFAAGAIDNAAFNVTETLTANPAAGGIVAASFGAGAIDAAAIAADAIGASELAADAVNEIADGIMTRASSNWEATAPVKSLGTAVMKAVHRIRDLTGTLEIYRSNGTTIHASQPITTDAANAPIDELGGAV